MPSLPSDRGLNAGVHEHEPQAEAADKDEHRHGGDDAGCVVAPGTVVPPHSLVMGVPGKVVKQVSEELQQSNRFQREEYCKEGAKYRQMQQKK